MVLINLVFIAIFLEAASFLLLRTRVLVDIFASKGLDKIDALDNQGLGWRTEFDSWGAWHKKHYFSRHVTQCFDVVYQSNNVGARDTKDYSRHSNDPRILLLGDSFAEGYTVQHEDTLAYMLQANLGIPVLNFGTAFDFGPLQYYLIYAELASGFYHEHLIILFLPMNDFIDNSVIAMSAPWIGKQRYRPYQRLVESEPQKTYTFFYPKDANKRQSLLDRDSNAYESRSIHQHINHQIRRLVSTTSTFRVIFNLRHRRIISNDIDTPSWSLSQSSEVKPTPWFSASKELQNAAMYWIDKTIDKASQNSNIKTITLFSIPTLNDFKYFQKHSDQLNTPLWVQHLNRRQSSNPKFRFINGLAFTPKTIDENAMNFQSCDPHWSPVGNHWAAEIIFKQYKSHLLGT